MSEFVIHVTATVCRACVLRQSSNALPGSFYLCGWGHLCLPCDPSLQLISCLRNFVNQLTLRPRTIILYSLDNRGGIKRDKEIPRRLSDEHNNIILLCSAWFTHNYCIILCVRVLIQVATHKGIIIRALIIILLYNTHNLLTHSIFYAVLY